MKKKTSNNNVLMLMLIILLLVLAVGYAAFSDILTISGTANAKGTFDLEFQNAEVVKNIGADVEKTTAVISEDKNTLTVNVSDLSYPGSGVEFSVDIVNVGTMPAEVGAVTPTNVTGSEKIKVTGLDVIKTDHPKLEVGDRCNIHFTVEWPADAGEILDSESSISFGLQIEYSQSTGEVFDGKSLHTDSDKDGNIIGDDIVEIPENALVKQITAEDYGKSINYKATVKNNTTNANQEVSNWKVLYNDKNNVYLILDDYLPINLVPEVTSLNTEGTYVVNSQTDRATLLNGLRTTSYWSEFANGATDAIAMGSPTFGILMQSYNEKYGTSLKTDSTISGTFTISHIEDALYVINSNTEVNVYWLASEYPDHSSNVWYMGMDGSVNYNSYASSLSGLRPVIKLPSSVTGTVEETVEIDY